MKILLEVEIELKMIIEKENLYLTFYLAELDTVVP